MFVTGPLANDDGGLIGSYLLKGLIPILFCFFCGQFQALFNWTKLGTMLAISGADFLSKINLTGIPLWVLFIILCVFINIFMASGSAKWAIFAPIFVPMFMLLGYHPGFTQLLPKRVLLRFYRM